MTREEKKIERHFNIAVNTALALVEKRARKILKKDPSLNEFIMGMGRYIFTSKDAGESLHEFEPKEIEDLITEWDEYLHFTGYPMRFTAEGERITDW